MTAAQGRSITAAALVLCAAAHLAAAPAGPQVGAPPPEIHAQEWINAAGPQSLAALRGRTVVVEFWATWCAPCRASMPKLNQLVGRHAAAGLTVIALTAEPAASVHRYLQSNSAQYIIGTASRSAQAYGVGPIPRSFIISPTGRLVWMGHPEEMEAALEQFLRQPPAAQFNEQDAAALAARLAEWQSRLGKSPDPARQVLTEAAAAVCRVPDGHPHMKSLEELLARLVERGWERLRAAQAQIAGGQAPQARVAIAEILRDYMGTPVADAAKSALKSIPPAGATVSKRAATVSNRVIRPRPAPQSATATQRP